MSKKGPAFLGRLELNVVGGVGSDRFLGVVALDPTLPLREAD
jgi:hypothetical protein